MSITMEQLRACRTLMREITAIEDFQRRIGGLRQGVSSTAFAGEYYGGGGNMRESAAWQALESVEELYRERICEYAHVVYLAEQAIAVLPTEQREIIRLRYVVGLPWREVSKRVGYVREYCFALHGQALEKMGIG